MAVVYVLMVISSADLFLLSQCQAPEKALYVDILTNVDLGMNIGLLVTYALAENVLACVLTAVTRLSCATNFEA